MSTTACLFESIVKLVKFLSRSIFELILNIFLNKRPMDGKLVKKEAKQQNKMVNLMGSK